MLLIVRVLPRVIQTKKKKRQRVPSILMSFTFYPLTVWLQFQFDPWSLIFVSSIHKVCSLCPLCHFNPKFNLLFVFYTENSTCHFDLQVASTARTIFRPKTNGRLIFRLKWPWNKTWWIKPVKRNFMDKWKCDQTSRA